MSEGLPCSRALSRAVELRRAKRAFSLHTCMTPAMCHTQVMCLMKQVANERAASRRQTASREPFCEKSIV